ncbi:Oncoprotein-induced transcript 3 protein [Branchiostoma belcheri]|nr:Oncoprotein-induced transcript 3 protein [Branchiostoma belcheri]
MSGWCEEESGGLRVGCGEEEVGLRVGCSAVSEKELEALRILGPLAVATEDFGGDFGDTEETEDTDGNTEETDEDTKNKDGDTDDTDGDTEDANGDTNDTDEGNEDTDGETEDTDEDTRDIAVDTQTIGDADGTDIGTEETDTKPTDVETEDTDEDTRDTEDTANGGTTDTDGDTETIGDADGTDTDTDETDTKDTDELALQSRRQNSDPCISYRVLNEAWRSVDYTVRRNSCDNGFRGEWYRFMNPAGTSMPTQRPQSIHRCGTHAPMWMNGQHPRVADGEVSRQACAYWSGRPCYWRRTIQVKACSAGYYVYKLPRVNHCYLGYCGASVDSALTTSAPAAGTTKYADTTAKPTPQTTDSSASTTCSNDYMELSIPEDQLTDIDLNNLHWRPDRNCGATTNGTHYLFRTELYDCGTEVTFGAKYVTFLNTINILGTHLNSGVITREGDIWITSKCNYERKEWVDATFLPIPGGLNFTEEGFGQLEVRLSMFPTRQYLRQYRADQYPIHLRLRQHVYMQLEVQGHAQKLSVLALNCKATMSPSPNDSLQYQLIRDGCASDPTLKTYDVDDPGKERFGFEAFRFIREVRTVYVHCEVLVCDAADSGSRCAQGCVRRGKRAAGEVDMRGRHMIYQGPIVLDDDKEAEHAVRLVDDQETGPARRGAPWAMLAAGCVLAALALVVLGAAVVQKRSRRGEWAYHGLKDGE